MSFFFIFSWKSPSAPGKILCGWLGLKRQLPTNLPYCIAFFSDKNFHTKRQGYCHHCSRMGGTFQARAWFQDSDAFQKATKMELRCILSVIFSTFHDCNFNPALPMYMSHGLNAQKGVFLFRWLYILKHWSQDSSIGTALDSWVKGCEFDSGQWRWWLLPPLWW